jgi:hypothetical protein
LPFNSMIRATAAEPTSKPFFQFSIPSSHR